MKITLFCIALLAVQALPAARPIQSEAAAMAKLFPAAKAFEPLAITLTVQDLNLARQASGRTPTRWPPRLLQALDAKGQDLGRVIFEDELGKHQPISIAFGLDLQGRLLGFEMLVYREQYGGAIERDSFRRQFVGKGQGSALRIGQDLDAVSGATISSQSMARVARRIVALSQRYLDTKLPSNSGVKK